MNTESPITKIDHKPSQCEHVDDSETTHFHHMQIDLGKASICIKCGAVCKVNYGGNTTKVTHDDVDVCISYYCHNCKIVFDRHVYVIFDDEMPSPSVTIDTEWSKNDERTS